MSDSEAFSHGITQTLRQRALAYPGTTEGASCVNRAFKAGGKKNFLFLGESGGQCKLMLRVSDPEAVRAAARDWAGDWPVGKTGWLNAKFPGDEAPPVEVLAGWIDESFRLLAPRSVLKGLE